MNSTQLQRELAMGSAHLKLIHPIADLARRVATNHREQREVAHGG